MKQTDFDKVHEAVEKHGGWYKLEEELKGGRPGNLKRQVRSIMANKIEWFRKLLNKVGLDFKIVQAK